MKKKMKQISAELLSSIDVLNTLNGGTSEATVLLKQLEDHREVRVFVPGISHEGLRVEIHNNYLTVFYLQDIVSGKGAVQVPKVVYSKQIPYFIDAEAIHAGFEGKYLLVTLPYNPLANGYHRSITINE